MRFLLLVSLAALVVPSASEPVSAARPKASAQQKVLVYDGQLQNEQNRPVSGIFPMTFGLYRGARGGRAMWKESHFVAVDSGRYTITLGEKSRLRDNVDLEDVYLSVELTGGPEILREKLDPAAVRDNQAQAATPAGKATTATPATTARTKDGRVVVDYADTAGEAYEAAHAKVADKLGNLSAKEVSEKLENVKSSARIGSSKRFSAMAGGEGGIHYEIRCPTGHVVTGVRGGSGLYIDSITLICQPLE